MTLKEDCMSFRKTFGVIVLVVLAGTVGQNAYAVSLATVQVTQSSLNSTGRSRDTGTVEEPTFRRPFWPGMVSRRG
jgi:hypothetical protein